MSIGVGTLIVGILHCSLETIVVGILQMILAVCIIGWVWSILWGYELLSVARRSKRISLGDDGALL